jgi:hypothetical protein
VFHEEEEDLTESEDEESKSPKSSGKWKKAIVKDIASFKSGDHLFKQRHSISKCESTTLKSSAKTAYSPPFSSLTAAPRVHSLDPNMTTLNLSLSEVGQICTSQGRVRGG